MISKNLRVLQLSAAYIGAQKQIEDAIHMELKQRGIASKVLYLVGDSNDPDYIQCESRIENLFRRAAFKYITKSHVFSRVQTKRIIKMISAFKPDIFHIHTIHHGYIDYPLLFDYLNENNIGIVFTVHDMWPFTGGCYHFSELECQKFITGCKKCCNLKERHDCSLKMTEKNYQRKMSCYEKARHISFVSVSSWVNQQLEKTPLAKYPHFVIHNSIVHSRYQSDYNSALTKTIQPIIKGKKVLLFVASSWEQGKGYLDICNLAIRLGEEYILLMVGNASDAIKEKSNENMFFTGYVKNKNDLHYLYETSDLHVSASKEETFGMTFVEAAIAGTKSVGFDKTAISETIHSVGGICVSSNQKDALYKAVLEHINDGKLSASEIERIKLEYSEEKMATKYLSVYEEMIRE